MRALKTSLVAAGMLLWTGTFEDSASAQIRRAEKECAFELVSPISFGDYDPMSDAPVDITGQISYRCYISISFASRAQPPDLSPIDVEISISEGLSHTFDRYLTGPGPADGLRYNLYLDPLHLNIWGDGRPGTVTYNSRALPNNQVTTVPVFGRLFRGQDVVVGMYHDVLVVTLDF